MTAPQGKLTAAQYEIMDLVWDSGIEGATITGLWDAIGQRRKLTRTTIQNLVDRLEKRGWLYRTKTDEGFRYIATTDRLETTRELAEGFLHEFFGGSAKDLVMSLFGSKRLTRRDLVGLRELLDAQLEKRSRKE
jgi:BlaI family transcriptional regulator, penicillinase repressor